MDINAAIDEVARRHHIRLTPDDPILVTVTVTELVHKVFAEHLKRLVKDVADQTTDRLAAQIEAGRREAADVADGARMAAATLVNGAGAWSADRLKEASAAATSDIDAAAARVVAAVDHITRTAMAARRVAVGAAGISVALTLLLVGAAVSRYLGG